MINRKTKIYGLLAIVAVATALLALALARRENSAVDAPPLSSETKRTYFQDPTQHEATARAQEIKLRFGQAVLMLHAKRFDHAVTALHRVLALAPGLPEAHVNMGYALLGLGRLQAARDFFDSAISLRPQQVNAYYGLAITLEGLGDKPAALGAMRTYVHLSRTGDPYVRKARAAIWEWLSQGEHDRPGAAKTSQERGP